MNDVVYVHSRYVHAWFKGTEVIFFHSVSMDILTGSMVDWDTWRQYEQPQPMTEEAKAFMDRGLLVKLGDEAPERALSELRHRRAESLVNRRRAPTILRISLTERCNMGCSYCFQQRIYSGAQPVMSRDTFVKTIMWLFDNAYGQIPSIQYFGGEPLLRMDLIKLGDAMLKEATNKAALSGYHQSITTNGTLMTDEIANFLIDNSIGTIFSLDGWKEVNDTKRKFKNGRGTFDDVMGGISRYRKAGGSLSILLTVQPDTLSNLKNIVKYCVEELGARTIGINSPQPTSEGWEVDGRELSDAIQNIWLYCRDQQIEFFGPGTHIPLNLESKFAQVDRCIDDNPLGSVARWPIYVSADGRFSMCVVHHNDHRCSLEQESQVRSDSSVAQWHFNSTDFEACDTCIASQICGGPCSLEMLMRPGQLNTDRCNFYKSLTEWVITQ